MTMLTRPGYFSLAAATAAWPAAFSGLRMFWLAHAHSVDEKWPASGDVARPWSR